MRYRRYRNPIRRLLAPLYGILWLIIVVIFLATGSQYPYIFIIGAILSLVLSLVTRLLIAGVIGAGLFGAASMFNQQQQQPPYQQPYQNYQNQQPYYQQPQDYQQPYYQQQPPYQPYQGGYQPPAPSAQPAQSQQPYYQPTPQPQYDQPQAEYPREMPPQEQ